MTVRVAALTRAYAPVVGGAERQLASLAPQLQARGVDLHVITRHLPGSPRHEVISGVPVHRTGLPGPRAFSSLSYTALALRVLRRLQPQVVHAHELFSPATTALTAKRALAVPVVATAHRSGPLGDVQLLGEEAFGSRRAAAVFGGVDRFVTISRDIADELQARGVPPSRQVHIPNGVDVDHFCPVDRQRQADLRARLDVSGGPVVVFTGRLAPEKRVHHLLSAWREVRAAHPSSVLFLLGRGEEEAKLRSLAGPGVRFVGAVDDVRPYLRVADAFVLPSIAEGLSVAMLEALACGVPPLMTTVGGTADVIEHGRHGWLVPPDDGAALTQGLLRLLGDEDLRVRMGVAGRQRVVEAFSLAAAADRHVALYEGIAR